MALFNPERLPAFHDPFAGGGALPLEAQRLGLEAYASDLNPVALIGKRIDLLYHKNATHRVEAKWNNESYGFLRPVDLAVNCRVKRDRNRNTQIETIS